MEKICTIVTQDKKIYKIGLDLLKRYSTFFSVMLEDEIVE